MRRRFLTSIVDHNYRDGAYATEWEGWKPIARIKVESTRQVYRFKAYEDSLKEKVDNCMGVYAILHETDNRPYALYVGFSAVLHNEIKIRLKARGLLDDPTTSVTALWIPNRVQATHYEDELIRYYAPPWNTKFHKQG